MISIKNLLKKKEIFIRLFLLSSICTVLVCSLTIVIVINKAQETYSSSYNNSNDIILDNIKNDYETLMDSINQAFEFVNQSNSIETYLSQNIKNADSILNLNRDIKNATYLFKDIPSSLILIGKNGSSFYQDQYTSNHSVNELLGKDWITTVDQTEAQNQIYFSETGLTTNTSQNPGIIYVRKLENQQFTYGYALFFIPEAFFSKFYTDTLDSTLHKTFIVDNNNQIISSSNKEEIGLFLDPTQKESTGKIKLPSYQFTLHDRIDQKTLIKNMELKKTGIGIFFISIFLAVLFSFFIFKKITSPIYSLIDKLSNVTTDKLNNKIELTGTYETKELGQAYNLMLTDLDKYINDLLEAEKENHLMEIKNLQMQIHPHYIYNTLTAIKFLIWQNETEKASEAITSFINLLKQTFNTQEIITLEKEMEITKDYINLLSIRYGTQIETTIFEDSTCQNSLVPKMIIQPIIENAYLHAFPNNQKGAIQIFTRKKEELLIIDIIDNGIGFDYDSQLAIKKLTNNYSSIGLDNINQRIKLLYGEDYGLSIESILNQGTSITLTLPLEIEK